MSALVTPAYGLEEFLVCDIVREIQAEPIELPKLKKKTDEELKEFKLATVVTRQRRGEERVTQKENPRGLQRGPLKYLAEY